MKISQKKKTGLNKQPTKYFVITAISENFAAETTKILSFL
jgi:hypothetical protein